MFAKEKFQHIKKTFDVKLKERKKHLSKIWGIILGVDFVVTMSLIVIFLEQINNDDLYLMIPIFGGTILVVALIGFIFSWLYQSEKPYIEYVNEQVVKHINVNEGLFLKYQAYDKTKDKFHTIGGLFPRYVSVKKFWTLEGVNDDNHEFHVYDCIMTSSSGQSQQTHFNGVYFTIEKAVQTTIQIRPNGRPSIKGVKYRKSPDYLLYKVYKPEHETINDIDRALIALYETLSHQPNHKKVYMSVVDQEVHVAIWYKKHPARRHKALTLDTLNELVEYFMSIYAMTNQASQI